MIDITSPSFGRYALGLASIWTFVLGGLLIWDLYQGRQVTHELAMTQARAHFTKDIAFRLWATHQQRIYVPVTDAFQPDGYLAHMPEREVKTPSGMELTLINPARIIRQLNEDYGSLYQVPGRITSPTPLRPENAPDEWERGVLESFAEGKPETLEFTEMDGEPYLRLMRPLRMVAGCVVCHAAQGLEVGDIAGGVGVAFPMKELMQRQQQADLREVLSYSLIWILGLIGISGGYRHFKIQENERQAVVGALHASEARKTAILDSALDGVVCMDHRGRIVEFNPAAEHTFGYRREQVIEQDVSELLVPPALRKKHLAAMRKNWSAGQGKVFDSRVETTAMRADGSFFPVEIAVSRVDVQGQPLFTAYLRDITESRIIAEQLTHQASHDSLTGLVNRREFEYRLEQAIEIGRQRKVEHTLFYIDLDQFKVVNDTCGHIAGDELLRQISALLHAQIRTRDTLGRLGGDEFGVLLENCPLDKALELGEKFLEVVKSFRFPWEDKTFVVGISVGVVPISGKGETLTDVLSAADSACYSAKDHGGNRIQVFNANDVDLARRKGEMRWVGRIHDAFENDRFILFAQQLQPLCQDLVSGRDHYELLIRLQDERGNFISPSAFVSAAERYNLMPSIDHWVIRTAFRWLNHNPDKLERLEMCSVNLSGRSVTDDDFLRFVVDRLVEYAIPGDKICFEITETVAVANLGKAIHCMQALKKHGCRFALDDFGSGMSSFAYLKNLPVDYLKIDGAFVRDIVDDPIDLAMVKSINDVGHVMGKRTIAEFVENDAILEELKEIGVDYVQGYCIALPQPVDSAEFLRVSGA